MLFLLHGVYVSQKVEVYIISYDVVLAFAVEKQQMFTDVIITILKQLQIFFFPLKSNLLCSFSDYWGNTYTEVLSRILTGSSSVIASRICIMYYKYDGVDLVVCPQIQKIFLEVFLSDYITPSTYQLLVNRPECTNTNVQIQEITLKTTQYLTMKQQNAQMMYGN